MNLNSTRNKFLTTIGIGFLSVGFNAFATLTMTSSNATYVKNTSSTATFAWPIATTSVPAACDNNGDWLYSSSIAALSPSDGRLYFNIYSNTAATEPRYVRTEYINASGTATALALNGDNTLLKTAYDGDSDGTEMAFSINLGGSNGLCKAAENAGLAANCQFTKNIVTGASFSIRIGVTSNLADALATTTSGENHDYNTYTFHLVRCGSQTNAYASSLENYKILVTPRDGGIKVSVTDSPNKNSSDFDLIGTIFILEGNTGARSTPLHPLSATNTHYFSGTNAGTFTIDGLTNDTTYNVQMAYVNEGGFVTVPGPPSPGTEAPRVTPSVVAGMLKDDACFIATASYGDSNDIRVRVLRKFRSLILLKSGFGRQFVRWYYHWSPPYAYELLNRPALRFIVGIFLFPVVLVAKFLLLFVEYPLMALSMCLLGVGVLVGRRRRQQFQNDQNQKSHLS